RDTVSAVAVDPSGNAILAGSTASNDFPLVNPLPGMMGGGFVAKMNASGTQLLYSTYISFCSPSAMALDEVGNMYLTGRAFDGFPTTPDAFQPVHYAGIDAFALKLNASGNAIVYATALGGPSNYDYGTGIAVDSAGCAY